MQHWEGTGEVEQRNSDEAASEFTTGQLGLILTQSAPWRRSEGLFLQSKGLPKRGRSFSPRGFSCCSREQAGYFFLPFHGPRTHIGMKRVHQVAYGVIPVKGVLGQGRPPRVAYPAQFQKDLFPKPYPILNKDGSLGARVGMFKSRPYIWSATEHPSPIWDLWSRALWKIPESYKDN